MSKLIKHKEILLYLFFGGLTFFINMFLFILLDRCFPHHELICNIICWGVCVLFQFFTNRTWVFPVKEKSSATDFIRQMISFFGGRLSTLAVEEVILAIFIVWLGMNANIVKLVAQVIVIVLNYVISKWVVFKV